MKSPLKAKEDERVQRILKASNQPNKQTKKLTFFLAYKNFYNKK